MEFITDLFNFQQFMPHGHCFLWRPDILWLNVGSDLVVALAYFSIPFLLVYFIKARPDVPFSPIFVLFAIFILLCGLTHVFEIWTIWVPAYGLEGLVKMATAISSICTASVLWLLRSQILAIPSTGQLRAANASLEREKGNLARLNQRLSSALDISGLGFWEFSAETKTVSREGKIFDVFGPSYDEKGNMISVWEERIHKEDIGRVRAEFETAVQGRKRFDTEMRMIGVSGEIRYIRAVGEPVLDAQGLLRSISGMIWDHTLERRYLNNSQAEMHLDSLQEERNQEVQTKPELNLRFKAIIDSLPTAIVITNQEGEIILANKEVERIFDYPSGELLGQKVEALIPLEFRGDHPKLRATYASAPEPRRMGAGRDLFGMAKNGRMVPIEIGLTPLRSKKGVFVLSSIIDITERKASQQRLDEQNARLLDASAELDRVNSELKTKNADLGQFVYTVSHDLRAPLVTIGAFTQKVMADTYVQSNAKLLDYLHRVDRNTKHLEQILKELLDLSRVSNRELSIEDFNLQRSIVTAIAGLEDMITEHKAQITVDPCSDLAQGQENLISQVFTNLISNAIKYAKPGISPLVHVGIERDGQNLVVSIKDNGRGIPADQHAKVFGIFERFHLDVQEGTGVGLAIVKKIVERHNGQVRFSSIEGVGTIFTLTLPVSKVKHDT